MCKRLSADGARMLKVWSQALVLRLTRLFWQRRWNLASGSQWWDVVDLATWLYNLQKLWVSRFLRVRSPRRSLVTALTRSLVS